jgi:hypothetical protein
VLLALVATGLFGFFLNIFVGLTEFMLWLFRLSLTEFGFLPIIEIIIKISTFLFSFSVVGYVFGFLRWFNSALMSFSYFVVSTLLGFGLSYLLMQFQTHIIIISWIFLITILLLLGIVLLKKRVFLLVRG